MSSAQGDFSGGFERVAWLYSPSPDIHGLREMLFEDVMQAIRSITILVTNKSCEILQEILDHEPDEISVLVSEGSGQNGPLRQVDTCLSLGIQVLLNKVSHNLDLSCILELVEVTIAEVNS